MRRVTDLTPKFSNLKPAEREFEVPYVAGERPMGESAGGLALYSNKFKRGYGDKVFGSDENGIWLGAAEFADAPFSVDMDGDVIANSIFISSSSFVSSVAGVNQQFSSGTPVDVNSSSFSFTLTRETLILVLVNLTGWVFQDGGAGDWDARGLVRLLVDGVDKDRTMISGGKTGTDQVGSTNSSQGLNAGGIHYLAAFSAGAHTIKLTAAVDSFSGSVKFNLYKFRISYMTFGNA